jgi:hypothetical protein
MTLHQSPNLTCYGFLSWQSSCHQRQHLCLPGMVKEERGFFRDSTICLESPSMVPMGHQSEPFQDGHVHGRKDQAGPQEVMLCPCRECHPQAVQHFNRVPSGKATPCLIALIAPASALCDFTSRSFCSSGLLNYKLNIFGWQAGGGGTGV